MMAKKEIATNEVAALKLVKQIQQCHDECQKDFESSIDWGIECGKLLCEAKSHLGHGSFGGYVEQYFDFSHRTASGYMKLHNGLGKLSNRQRASILKEADSLRGLQLLLSDSDKGKPGGASRSSSETTPASPGPASGEAADSPAGGPGHGAETQHQAADRPDAHPSAGESEDPFAGEEGWVSAEELAEATGDGKGKPKTPPKQLDRSAWYKQWDQSIGPLVRLVDKIASAVGESKCESHKVVQEHLNIATEEMMEWMGVKK